MIDDWRLMIGGVALLLVFNRQSTINNHRGET